MLQAIISYVQDRLRGSDNTFDCYLKHGMIVKSWDNFLFYIRPRTSDLYAVCCEEVYELENWFKPFVKGIVVDVGAYIGTYTARAMNTADLVVAIEPLPINFKALQINVALNAHKRKAKVILVNKALAERRKESKMFVPIRGKCIGAGTARLQPASGEAEKLIGIDVSADTLDNIMLERLGIDEIHLLKIDIEGYVLKALPGMISSLKKTKILFIELLGEDLPAIRTLKRLGFKLKSRHGKNFLFVRE
ncbi:MAG: FkbM family methyltransferase [Desulfurococcaceae archaeon]|nr:FkbM family methyltransferase [Desulfurococcaceae archaeon]